MICRSLSVVVTLTLAKRLGAAGYGRVEFAFNAVLWLVLIVRDCFEMIVTREISRHPRLTDAIVSRVLAIKGMIAGVLYLGLVSASMLGVGGREDVGLFAAYGLLLFSTAMGLDYAFRARERVGLVALSLLIRTGVYAGGVLWDVRGAGDYLRVPMWLVGGEAIGIGLVWVSYLRNHGRIRPVFSWRFQRVFLRRGRSVVLIQLSQTFLLSADLLLVGAFCTWAEVGRYGAPHRMVAAILAFGMIFQQVIFPTLARSWRDRVGSGPAMAESASRLLISCFLPVAVGGTLLAGPLLRWLLPEEYDGAALYLRVGIWRVPVFTLAFFYQSMLVAMGRETAGLRFLLGGVAIAGPSILLLLALFGPAGAGAAVVATGVALVASGFLYLRGEGRAPAWHHHAARPLLASALMVPVCLVLVDHHAGVAVVGGGTAYVAALAMLGGLPRVGWSGAPAAPGVAGEVFEI